MASNWPPGVCNTTAVSWAFNSICQGKEPRLPVLRGWNGCLPPIMLGRPAKDAAKGHFLGLTHATTLTENLCASK